MTGTQSVAVASRGKPEARRPEPFELKGTMASFTVLRLKSTDLQLVEHQLRAKTSQLPSLFLDAPVLIDLAPLGDEAASGLPLAEVARLVRACQMIPVAVAHVPDAQRAAAVDAGLGVWRGPISTRVRAGAEPTAMPSHSGPSVGVAETPGPQPALSQFNGPVVVTKPVRGGQVVYAQNNDLVVLAPVNPGAQVIADGHLHVYAPMRGRGVAGAQGLPGARIFCQKLEAELLAISGAYVMAEEIPVAMRGRAVQVHLEDGECRLTAL
ncbi:MAG TPA: septum site-determining protein MinC [Polyangia bacterium]|nr:septum site-determining protein MinC [Polyangia bacterium]HVY39377.1 septum site-determining protein MinC [Polyangia bacterium]